MQQHCLKCSHYVPNPTTASRKALSTRRSIHIPQAQHRSSEGQNGHTPSQSQQEDEDRLDSEDALRPEEDWTVPGGYQDSLSKNTKLGRAVDDACSELSHLGDLERDSLMKANELLRKLGYKGNISSPQIPPSQKPGD